MFDNHTHLKPYPVIGIRPVIDPRRAVYHATYDQIYSMAERIKDFYESQLRYPDGTPLRCYINKKCISNALEARQCHDDFARNNVCALLTVAAGWCYPMEIMEIDGRLPHAIWGFNGTERPGAVYLAAAASAGNSQGHPLFRIYGKDIQDKDSMEIPVDVEAMLLKFAKCALTVGLINGRSYLSVGTVSMGIASSFIDHNIFRQYLGMRTVYIDMTEIDRRLQQEIYDKSELEKAMRWVNEKCNFGEDRNPPLIQRSNEQKRADIEDSVKMVLIVRDMMEGNPRLADSFPEEAAGYDATAAGFQGQRGWTNYRVNGDFMEAVLNSGFDWNGPRAPFIVATENDGMNALSMLFGTYLTHTAQIFCDVRSFWSPEAVKRVTGYELEGIAADGIIHLLNSGSAALEGTGAMSDSNGEPVIKPYWEATDTDRDACLANVHWSPGMLNQFYGGGYSSAFSTEGGMPVTMVRLNIVYGIGLCLQLAEGITISLPDDINTELLERTDPTWPSTWFVPAHRKDASFKDAYSLMQAWGANHCSLCYGHVGAEFITLAAMLRIPVLLHNIPDEQIFRPALWKAYGLREHEAADRDVCAKLGPLYN